MLYSSSGSMRIETSEFSNNNARYEGVLNSYRSNTTVHGCKFEGNLKYALYFDGSTVSVKSNEFHNNSVEYVYNGVVELEGGSVGIVERNLFQSNNGSAISCDSSSITIRINEFYNNFGDGGILTTQGCITCTIQNVKVYNNRLGSMFISDSNCTIDGSEFKNNFGQIIIAIASKVVISDCEFDNNTEYIFSLPVLSCGGSIVTLINSNFTNNNEPIIGTISSTLEYYGSLLIVNNSAVNGYAIIHLATSQFIGHHSGNATISNNIRSIVAISSNITLMGTVRFSNN